MKSFNRCWVHFVLMLCTASVIHIASYDNYLPRQDALSLAARIRRRLDDQFPTISVAKDYDKMQIPIESTLIKPDREDAIVSPLHV